MKSNNIVIYGQCNPWLELPTSCAIYTKSGIKGIYLSNALTMNHLAQLSSKRGNLYNYIVQAIYKYFYNNNITSLDQR